MAEFFTTAGISHKLEDIINDAEERLFLISPYLQINDRLKEIIKRKTQSKSIDIRLIYRSNELRPEENNWLESMPSIRTMLRNSLHAKCYMNEKEALLTSMNLYEYSQRNNDEMGIVVSREKDEELYSKIYEAVKGILDGSEEIRVTVSRVETTGKSGDSTRTEEKAREPRPPREPRATLSAPEKGFCIRCGDGIPINPDQPVQPYCGRCYASWNRYKNEEYEEKHCHTCGIEHVTSMSKPLCLDCYRKYKDVLQLVAS